MSNQSVVQKAEAKPTPGAIAIRPDAELLTVPAIIADLGDNAARRFLEFFTANIRNENTRAAYAQAVAQFLRWCEAKGIALKDVEPIHVAGHIELLQQRANKPLTAPSVKQHLAAIRTLFRTNRIEWTRRKQRVRLFTITGQTRETRGF